MFLLTDPTKMSQLARETSLTCLLLPLTKVYNEMKMKNIGIFGKILCSCLMDNPMSNFKLLNVT